MCVWGAQRHTAVRSGALERLRRGGAGLPLQHGAHLHALQPVRRALLSCKPQSNQFRRHFQDLPVIYYYLCASGRETGTSSRCQRSPPPSANRTTPARPEGPPAEPLPPPLSEGTTVTFPLFISCNVEKQSEEPGCNIKKYFPVFNRKRASIQFRTIIFGGKFHVTYSQNLVKLTKS